MSRNGPAGASGLEILSDALLRANLAEAVLAIDRPVFTRTERNLRLGAALCADGVKHLPRHPRGALTRSFSGVSAVLTAQRLVREPLLRVKLLLAGGEHKLLAAVEAMKGLVDEGHATFPLKPTGLGDGHQACLDYTIAPQTVTSRFAKNVRVRWRQEAAGDRRTGETERSEGRAQKNVALAAGASH